MDLFTTGTAEISQCDDSNEPVHDRPACPVCEVYRYELRRTWDATQGLVCWVMLNPSTANADEDDATIRRCMAFARDWGYGGIVVRNLFALRATDPRELRRHPHPIGPRNDRYLLARPTSVAVTVAAWGADPAAWNRTEAVRFLMATTGTELWCLGTNRDGSPKHPLYIKSATHLVPYPAPKRDKQ